MRRLETALEVVEALGGHETVAAMSKNNIKSVYRWTGRHNQFPAQLHHMMTEALGRQRCSAPAKLWGQMSRAKAARRKLRP